MRKRHFALIAGLVCAAGVVAYQAVTHREPDALPRIEAAGDAPRAPTFHYACTEDHRELIVYTTNRGETIEPVLSGRFCNGDD